MAASCRRRPTTLLHVSAEPELLPRSSSCPSISRDKPALSVPSLRHSASGSSIRHADQEVEFLVQQVRHLCHERKSIRQAMERLDQRCCTEAIELRAQLRCAQQRFAEQRQRREELRRELQVAGSREKFQGHAGHAMGREIGFLQSHVESLQSGCSRVADHALSVKDDVRGVQHRIELEGESKLLATEEASSAQQGLQRLQEELMELQSSIQRSRQETSQVQQKLQASESRLRKEKEDGEREVQKSLKRLQAKLKAAVLQEEELKGRLEETKARRADLQTEETSLKDRLLKQEEELAKIREIFGVEGSQSSSLAFCEQFRTERREGPGPGLPLQTHQRILQEQSDVYRDALDKLGNLKEAVLGQSTLVPLKDEPELEQALAEAVEAEEAQAQIHIQILDLTQELELSSCKLQLLKDSLLTERGRKAELSRSLCKIRKIQDRGSVPSSPSSSVPELRQRLQHQREWLRRRLRAIGKLQGLLPQTAEAGEDLRIMVQQFTLAVPSIPKVSCTDLTEIESMQARLLSLRQTGSSYDWNSDSALQRISKSSASLHFLELASERSTSAVQETIRCVSGCLEPSFVEGFVALLQSHASAAETRIAPEVQQVLGAVRFTREQAAKEAAHTSWKLQPPRPLEDSRLQSLQNACVTCAAKLAEISARLSLSNDAEDTVKELMRQEELELLSASNRRCVLEQQRCRALEAALKTREALSQRRARASLDARHAAQAARHPLEKAIEEATLELETLREELPAEVQRLEKSCEDKWQRQTEAPSTASTSALRQRIEELNTQHVSIVDTTERKRSEESHAEVERREQEAELQSSALQQQQLQEAKRRTAQEVEKCRFSLWDVEQEISDATEARYVQLRRAEIRMQELTREHSMKMADMKSEAQKEVHRIRNSGRRLARSIAEELETSDFDQALRRSGDLDQKSAELLQCASKQLETSLAAAGA